jgi:hypothetical protein
MRICWFLFNDLLCQTKLYLQWKISIYPQTLNMFSEELIVISIYLGSRSLENRNILECLTTHCGLLLEYMFGSKVTRQFVRFPRQNFFKTSRFKQLEAICDTD